MGTSRFLVSATLLLGGCESLWGVFGETNPGFCDPATPGCISAMNADGGADLAVADVDASMADTDAGAGTGDASAAVDAAVADSAQGPDLLCEPTTSLWVTDPDVLSIATNLTGVAGNGVGDLWVVGNTPLFVAHYKNSWNTITVPALSIASFGRAVYSPKLSQVLAIGSTALGSGVAHLTAAAISIDSFGLLSGVPGGLWISAAPESQPYLTSLGSLGIDPTLKAYNGSSWQDVVSSAPIPFPMAGIAGSGTGAATTVWGVSTTNNPVASFTTATKWKTATTTAGTFNSVWVSPIRGVVVVGENGAIMNTPAAQTVNPLTSMGSPVSTPLNDVAGTVDGSHLWAVGDGGTIVHWNSGCQKWTRETNTNTKNLNALWVDDARKMVWAVGAGGAVLYRKFP